MRARHDVPRLAPGSPYASAKAFDTPASITVTRARVDAEQPDGVLRRGLRERQHVVRASGRSSIRAR